MTNLAELLKAQGASLDAEDDLEKINQLYFERGWGDGLPIVPPTAQRVAQMLAYCDRPWNEPVARMAPRYGEATPLRLAANAVMAGCRPEYFPLVTLAIEAMCEEPFNLYGIQATTHLCAPLVIVNGPVAKELGINCGHNAFGPGTHSNATIGRAIRLALVNIGGAIPTLGDMSTFGSPAKYTYCVAENEAASPWQPLHVERGFARDESTVTLFAGEAPRAVMDQASRSARSLCESLGRALATVMHHKLHGFVDVVLVLSPEHVQKCVADGFGKAEIRRAVQEVTARPLRELLPDERCAEGIPLRMLGITGEPPAAMLDMPLAKFRSDDQITIVVAGGDAGMFSAIIGGWVAGEMGSQMVTRKIAM